MQKQKACVTVRRKGVNLLKQILHKLFYSFFFHKLDQVKKYFCDWKHSSQQLTVT